MASNTLWRIYKQERKNAHLVMLGTVNAVSAENALDKVSRVDWFQRFDETIEFVVEDLIALP